jgi:hypothetical protein
VGVGKMITIEPTFDQLVAADGCSLIDHTIKLVGNSIPITDTPRESADVVIYDVQSSSIELRIHNTSYSFRWLSGVQMWQNTSGLLDDFMRERCEPDFDDVIKRIGLSNKKTVLVVDNRYYTIGIEKSNNCIFLHSNINVWNKEAKVMFFADVNKLQREVPLDSYIYSIKPNIEYSHDIDTTFKFAEMIGYRYWDTVVLGDGFEHDVYLRKKETIL